MKRESDAAAFHKVAQQFATDSEVVSVQPLGQGLINDTFVAETAAGTRYILQKINSAVFPDINALQDNLLKITDHIRRCLEREGVSDLERKVLTPVVARNGELYVEEDNQFWRMTLYIEDSCTFDQVTPDMAAKTGEAFARFHAYFAEPDAPELKETIKDFHNVGFRIQQLREAAEADSVGRLAECKDEVENLLARADEMTLAFRLEQEGKLPRRVAHCDTKLNNILFDKGCEILCVIDLDTTMPGFVLSDFGDFIRTAANTGREDDTDLDHVSVDMEIFRNFARGYVQAAPFLTKAERDTLPFGAKMLTYMQSVRFLTDYLNGDTYYKISYPTHNLVRTRAQMKLLESIDSHMPEMEAFVASM